MILAWACTLSPEFSPSFSSAAEHAKAFGLRRLDDAITGYSFRLQHRVASFVGAASKRRLAFLFARGTSVRCCSSSQQGICANRPTECRTTKPQEFSYPEPEHRRWTLACRARSRAFWSSTPFQAWLPNPTRRGR